MCVSFSHRRSPAWNQTVELKPTGPPFARAPAIMVAVLVFPSVPVTPMTANFRAGQLYQTPASQASAK
jgi:hypothetical protein